MKPIVLMAILLCFAVYAQDVTDDKNHMEKQVENPSEPNKKDSEALKSEKPNEQEKQDKEQQLEEKNDKSDNPVKNSQKQDENDTSNTSVENSKKQETSSDDSKKARRKKIVIIGKLVKTKPLALKKPSEYALEDDHLYKSTDYYVGNLFIHSRKKRDLSHLEGKVVAVHGYLDKDLNKIIEKIGMAPADYGAQESRMQIRSDWVGEETGFTVGHSTTDKLRDVPFVRYYKIKECRSFRVKKYFENRKIEIVFRNELRKSIANLALVAHYESVFGKPVPMYQDKKIKNLAPGDKASFVIPMTISSIKKYRLHAVKVHAENGSFVIDISETIDREE